MKFGIPVYFPNLGVNKLANKEAWLSYKYFLTLRSICARFGIGVSIPVISRRHGNNSVEESHQERLTYVTGPPPRFLR